MDKTKSNQVAGVILSIIVTICLALIMMELYTNIFNTLSNQTL